MLLCALLLSAISPDVNTIIENHIAARGGHERIAALQSLVFRGEYREGEHVSPNAVMALMRPYYKLVGDPDQPVREFAEGYDGASWEYYADPGIVLRTVGPASAASRHRARFDHPLTALRAQGATAVLEGVDGSSYKLLVTLEDGFREEMFIDRESWMIVAERKAAPIHAFGEKVRTETRFADFRPVDGVLFPFLTTEVDIATGRVISTFTTTSIVANRKYDPSVFSPPEFKRTPIQRWIELLFAERDDIDAVKWTYRDFRNANPSLDTHEAADVAGYQMLKMNQLKSAIALLEANVADYPRSADAAFNLGRAYRAAGTRDRARSEFARALELDPKHARAAQALKEMDQ